MVAPRRWLLPPLLLLGLLLSEPTTARRAKKSATSKPSAPSGSGARPPPGMTPQVMAQLRPIMDAAEGNHLNIAEFPSKPWITVRFTPGVV